MSTNQGHEVMLSNPTKQFWAMMEAVNLRWTNEDENNVGLAVPRYTFGATANTVTAEGLVLAAIEDPIQTILDGSYPVQSASREASRCEAVKIFMHHMHGALGPALRALGFEASVVEQDEKTRLFAVKTPSLERITKGADNGLQFVPSGTRPSSLLGVYRQRTQNLAQRAYGVGLSDEGSSWDMIVEVPGVALLSPDVVTLLQQEALRSEQTSKEGEDPGAPGRALGHFILIGSGLSMLSKVFQDPHGHDWVTPTPTQELGFDLDIAVRGYNNRSEDNGQALAESVLAHVDRLSTAKR